MKNLRVLICAGLLLAAANKAAFAQSQPVPQAPTNRWHGFSKPCPRRTDSKPATVRRRMSDVFTSRL
jgi:hypothetical protein